MAARIIGTGSCLPELAVHNRELEKIVDTTDEWIRSRTGIEKRRIAVKETTTSMAVEAARLALESAGIKPQELDMILVGTISADKYFPSAACEVQMALGAKSAVAFDISAACSGFLFGLGIVNAYMEAGMIQTALVIGAETLSKMIDWSDRSTCVLFGDGAGAAVIRREEQGILSMVQGSDGEKGSVLTCENRRVNNPYIRNLSEPDYTSMNGQEVYKFAVKTVPKAIEEALIKAGTEADEVKYFLLHQANIRIIEAIAKRLGQPDEKFCTNLQECGNISAGSVPILLDFVNRDGILQKGDKIVLAGFGAGLTWGAAVLVW